MMHEAALCVAADHPALPGHFPGHPVVPGVVLLELVIEAVESALSGKARGIASAKFPNTLAPGVVCRVLIRRRDDGRIEARCVDGSRTIMTAVLETDG
jgi:3-hydroxymyristoyl/3-hydroxydecanoyl-(acyl carrier protein) dehydratase